MPQHVVVIGAVALGPKAACRFKRLQPDALVTMIDKDQLISYGGCGIPYYVGGEVSEVNELRTTSFHMLRDPDFFKEVKGVNMRTGCEALAVDRKAKSVTVRDLATGKEETLTYDKLVLATGATPRRLNLPGENLPGVHYVSTPQDAVRIRESMTKGEVGRAVILGAGFIGLEMAEAFADMWEIDTTVVELFPQIMPRFCSPVMARMAQLHMEEKGVNFLLGESVQRIEGEGRVQRVVTRNNGVLEADAVIISVGVVPNDTLARQCGLAVDGRGGILVDETMRTTDPDIFAGGDCAVIRHQLTGRNFYLPLGSMANRQGRVIGNNLAGGHARFEGAVGSWVVKLFDQCLAGVGFAPPAAKEAGFKAESVILTQLDRSHFYPTKQLMTLELCFDPATRRVLGIQGLGGAGDATVGRINMVAGLLGKGLTVDEMANLELAYSPPFASAMDVLNALGCMADNALAGRNQGVGPDRFNELWEQRDSGEYFFLDCREFADARPYQERHPEHWHNIPQGKLLERLAEVPRDKTVVLVCNTGGRSYEAQIQLHHLGFDKVVNVHGGMAVLKFWGLDI